MQKYTHRFTVPASAIDALGHANNIEYVRWVQDTAVAHSDHVGLPWGAYRAMGAAFVVRRHSIEYLRSVREGEALEATTWIEKCARITADRVTQIADASGQLVATSRTLWAFVSLTTWRPVRIPVEVRLAFGQPPRVVG